MSKIWFYKKADKEFGPITAKELRALAESNTLTSDDLVKMGDSERWVPARRVSGLFRTSSVDSAVTTDSTEAPAEDRTDTTQSNPTAQSLELAQPIEQKDYIVEIIQSASSTSTPKPLSTKGRATIKISDLQESASFGLFAALLSWPFFGDPLHLIAGGVIVALTTTIAQKRLAIDIDGSQSKAIHFIASTSTIFITSWMMGTVALPIISITLFGIIWITNHCIERERISKSHNAFSSILSSAFRINAHSHRQSNSAYCETDVCKATIDRFHGPTNQNTSPLNPTETERVNSKPQLWNPIAAVALSIIASWSFAAILIAINWMQLSKTKRALRSVLWTSPMILYINRSVPFNNKDTIEYVALFILGLFTLFEAVPQIYHIKGRYSAISYRRNWRTPLIVAIGMIAILKAVPVLLNTSNAGDQQSTQLTTSTLPPSIDNDRDTRQANNKTPPPIERSRTVQTGIIDESSILEIKDLIGCEFEQEGYYLDSKSFVPHGQRKIFRHLKTGEKRLKLIDNWVNGDRNGECIAFYSIDKPAYRVSYINGMAQGKSTQWYESGKVKAVVYMEDNKPTGPFEEYFENGKIKRSATQIKGFIVGDEKLYWENGVLAEINHYDKDFADTYLKTKEAFWPDGRLKYRIGYRGDELPLLDNNGTDYLEAALERLAFIIKSGPVIRSDGEKNGGIFPTHMNFDADQFEGNLLLPQSSGEWWKYRYINGEIWFLVDNNLYEHARRVKIDGIQIFRTENRITEKLDDKDILSIFNEIRRNTEGGIVSHDYIDSVLGPPNSDLVRGKPHERLWFYKCKSGVVVAEVDIIWNITPGVNGECLRPHRYFVNGARIVPKD